MLDDVPWWFKLVMMLMSVETPYKFPEILMTSPRKGDLFDSSGQLKWLI